jgi:hypothetical protein
VQAAKQFAQEALHTPLPKAAEQAITAGKPWRGTVKAATLDLTRDDWPTGKRYELGFLIRPAGQTPSKLITTSLTAVGNEADLRRPADGTDLHQLPA